MSSNWKSTVPLAIGCLFLAACGGGGGVGNGNTLGVEVSYPTSNANLGGEVEQSTVTGRLTRAQGGSVALGDVNFIDVNGQMAVQDMDDPSRWSVQVPVGMPDDTLDVSVEFSDGSTDSATVNLANKPSFAEPRKIAINPANGRVLVADPTLDAVVAVDPGDGTRTIVSGAGTGSGPELERPAGIAMDAANDRALVVDSGLDVLVGIDLATGDRALLSPEASDLTQPQSVAVDAANDRALVMDRVETTLFEVDLDSGVIGPVSGGGVGTGPEFSSPRGIAVDAPNDRVLVVEGSGVDALLAVDLTTGDRTVLSDATTGNGPEWASPVGVDVVNNQALVTDTQLDAVISVDLSGAGEGNRTIVSNDDTGSGPAFSQPEGVAIDTSGFSVTTRVVDRRLNALVTVDLSDGDRTVLSGDDTAAGPSLSGLAAVALDPANDRALVAETGSLVAVDLTDGNRTVLSDADAGTGSGPELQSLRDVALDPANDRAIVVDSNLEALIAVDLTDGDRDILSDASTDSGPALSRPESVVVDAANDRALVVEGDSTLIAVDLSSGDRTTVIPNIQGLRGVALDVAGRRALMVSDAFPKVHALDFASGSVTTLSGASTGSGPALSRPVGIALDANERRAFVLDRDHNGVLVVELESGERAIASK